MLLVSGAPPDVATAVERQLKKRKVEAIRWSERPGGQQESVLARALIQQVEATLRRAEELFYKVQHRQASNLLSEEIRRSGKALAQAGRLDLLRQLHLWRGVCLIKGGDADAAARKAFLQALLLDRKPLDAARFPPQVIDAFAGAVRELSQRPRGALSIKVETAGARISIDGRLAPQKRIELPVGAHWVVVEALGYMPAVRRVMVSEKPSEARFTLEEAPPSVARRQLEQERDLDRTRPAVARLLARLAGAQEVVILSSPKGRLRLVRLRAADGRQLGRFESSQPAAEKLEATVGRAVMELWPPKVASQETPLYKRWWLWTIVGVVVVGGTVGGVLAATSGDDPTPSYTLRVP